MNKKNLILLISILTITVFTICLINSSNSNEIVLKNNSDKSSSTEEIKEENEVLINNSNDTKVNETDNNVTTLNNDTTKNDTTNTLESKPDTTTSNSVVENKTTSDEKANETVKESKNNDETEKPKSTDKNEKVLDREFEISDKKGDLIDSNKITLIDRSGDYCAQAIEYFFEDENGIYYFNCIKSNNMYVIVKGVEYKLVYALENKIVTIKQLEENGYRFNKIPKYSK